MKLSTKETSMQIYEELTVQVSIPESSDAILSPLGSADTIVSGTLYND